MGKKKRARQLTSQEAMIAEFSMHSISFRSTFHPKQWRSGTEPADMIIIIDRALIFVNMTEGKSYFNDLFEHNIIQAKDRMAEWIEGRQIRGNNSSRSFSIKWNDVDHILLLSIVDGPHALCGDHDPAQFGLDRKVHACVSLTSNVMRRLAELGGGARDLINLAKSLRSRETLTEAECLDLIELQYSRSLSDIVFEEVSRAYEAAGKEDRLEGDFLLEQYHEVARLLRSRPPRELEAFTDLSWSEIVPMVAFIVVASMQAIEREQGSISLKVIGGGVRILAIVSTSSAGFARNATDIIEYMRSNGCNMAFVVHMHFGGTSAMVMLDPNYKPTATMNDIAALRRL